MPSPSAINKLTNTRIQVRLLGDEEEGNQEEGEPMDTKAEAAGEPSSSRARGKRIYGLRDVQNDQSDKLVALQDQMNILPAKFDSFSTQQ